MSAGARAPARPPAGRPPVTRRRAPAAGRAPLPARFPAEI